MMFSRVGHAIRLAWSTPRLAASYSSESSLNKVRQILHNVAADSVAKEESASTVPAIPVKMFKAGHAIEPHDLTYQSRVPPRYRRRPVAVAPSTSQAKMADPFYQLQVDPLTFSTNPLILSNYITEMGQIKPRTTTGLTVKSQRRLGKAIRRARMMGVLPILSRTPEARWSGRS